MSGYPPSRSGAPRISTTVICSGCGVETTVPFTPTPGRPVFCRECFAKRQGGPEGSSRSSTFRSATTPPPTRPATPGGFPSSGGTRVGAARIPPPPPEPEAAPAPAQSPSRFGRDFPERIAQPKKHMLAQGRKAHFVFDAKEILSNGKMPEEQRRAFIETLFTRGARISSESAYEYLVEKHEDKSITEDEAKSLHRLLREYSFRR